MYKKRTLALLTLLFALFNQAYAEPKPFSAQPSAVQKAVRPEIHLSANKLKWSLGQDKVEGHLNVDVVLSTLNRFHLYESRTSFYLAEDVASDWTLKIVEKPVPTRFFDPVSKSLVPGYVGQALFRLELSPKNTNAAKQAQKNGLKVIANFQACSESICLLPANLLLDVALSDESASVATPEASLFSQAHLESLISHQLGASWWAFIILFFAGILTAFTPCVYPMYPITIGIFSRWSTEAHAKTSNTFLLSVLYCLGITASYAVLGLITAATGAVFGTVTQSPWFLIGVGMILFVSGILFSGIIPFTLPTSFINKVSTFNPNSKLGPRTHSFVFGATLGIVASPCVGPVLIAVLSWTSAIIAARDVNSYLLGFSYLAVFGLGMSFPFLVMSQMILKLKKSPHLGNWTPWIKKIGTVLLLASSLYFLIPGFRYLELRRSANTAQNAAKMHLIKTYSIYDAPKGVPMLIDFRADWCSACIEIESKTLTDPKVVDFFKSGTVSLVKVDMTVLNADNEAIAKKYGVLSLPALIMVGANGETCHARNTFEFISATDLLTKLNTTCP